MAQALGAKMSTLVDAFEDFILSRGAALYNPETIDFYRRIGSVETPLSPSKYSVMYGDCVCADPSVTKRARLAKASTLARAPSSKILARTATSAITLSHTIHIRKLKQSRSRQRAIYDQNERAQLHTG